MNKFLLIVMFASLVSACNTNPVSNEKLNYTAQEIDLNQQLYSEKIQPLFNARCVACHSCFNSPCQLNLTSYDGIQRGANKENIYDFSNFEAKDPTRLYIDAHSEADWRKKGFYPVTKSLNGTAPILYHSVAALLGIESGEQKQYNSEYSRYCVKSTSFDEMERFKEKNPAGRMPFGLPRLGNHEINLIGKWQHQGAFGPTYKEVEKEFMVKNKTLQKKISSWENLFNGPSIKSQLSSRYIYEHLFLAHLYFETSPKVFFRLVRSKTGQGPIQEIGTAYPFDSPGGKFHYRLRPVINTLTHKSHIPFALSEAKHQRWQKLFYQAPWQYIPKKLPPYGKPGGNPFQTFKAIPVKSRYQFFLDEAGYHVMTFIKGPVCRGQTALNVINDHFWVMFIDPEQDVFVNSPATYEKVAKTMTLPAEIQGDFNPFIDFRKTYWQGIQTKYNHMKNANISLGTESIWSGNKTNPNALLTIYRHHDSSNVIRGLRGQMPKTVWVIDYHVFESIYYNLTAGYDVFGPWLHQINSRLFMEISRISSEDMFISMLPQKNRKDVRGSWNIPTPQDKNSKLKWAFDAITGDVEEKMKFDYAYPGPQVKTTFKSKGQPVKKEFLQTLIKNKFSPGQIGSDQDIFNRHLSLGRLKKNRDTDLFQKIVSSNIPASRYLPNTILIRLKSKPRDKAYTLILNKDHYNVSMIFFESKRLRHEKNSIDILPGINTSYANLFMVLTEKELKDFSDQLVMARNRQEVWQLLRKYGVSRQNAQFWQHYEWLSAQSYNPLSNESGWLDLNRYLNL